MRGFALRYVVPPLALPRKVFLFGFFFSDSVKRHLSRRHLSVLNFLFNLFSMVGAPAKKKSAFAKAASIPARRQSENADPRLFGFIFRRRPPSRRFFPIFRAQH